jgi:hypothetical protein
MTLSIEHQIRDGYVRFDVAGSWSLSEIFRLIDLVRKETDAAAVDRALVDLREVPGPIAEMDRFFAGQRVAAVLKNHIRLAVVARAEYINKFGENVAVNRGAQMAVMSSEEHAMTWLEGKS